MLLARTASHSVPVEALAVAELGRDEQTARELREAYERLGKNAARTELEGVGEEEPMPAAPSVA